MLRKVKGPMLLLTFAACAGAAASDIGREVAIERHLEDGEEFQMPVADLIRHGKALFDAQWTIQEGAGRPQSTGTGRPLADDTAPLDFPRNANRISGPDANACAGCHNLPRSGGAGDRVANVFVLGQRFDFASFDPDDLVATRGAVDERLRPVTLQGIANERNTVGMFGSGYIEMLARRFTARLQAQRDALEPGGSVRLTTQGIDFGLLVRSDDGRWDTSGVTGLPAPSLQTAGPDNPPSLVLRPFHQAGAVVSLREFTNNALNHHHGIQTVERFGSGDPDGDGVAAELSRGDVTAITLYQATLPVPGRVIPRDPVIEAAVRRGEAVFDDIGCGGCHRAALLLDAGDRIFVEPNPYNPPGNLQPGDTAELGVDLSNPQLGGPRLERRGRMLVVPAYTDLKLHDITSGSGDPNCEPLNQHFAPGSEAFFAGNCRFLTSRLWGVADSAPYMHHGKFTTMREAIEAHFGEAAATRAAWMALDGEDRDAVIEFLKTLRVLPRDVRHRVVDERSRPRRW